MIGNRQDNMQIDQQEQYQSKCVSMFWSGYQSDISQL